MKTRVELLLAQLSEECHETGQRAIKALRFGVEEIQEGQALTNAQRIVYEFNDLVAVMQLLQQEGVIDRMRDQEQIDLKLVKIEKWIKYSQKIDRENLPF